MFSRRIVLALAAVGAAAIAIVGAVPAYALSTVTITAGSAPAGTSVAINSTTASGTNVALKVLTTNATASCTSSSLTGTLRAGANSPANVGQINGGAGQIAFNSCTTLGIPFTINGVGTTKWTIAATANTVSGTTPINITGINVVVSSTSCRFNVSGSVAGSFVNGNPSKALIPATTMSTSNLVVSNLVLLNGATKCLGGAVTNTTPGNKISVAGTWNKTATNAAYNPLAIVAS